MKEQEKENKKEERKGLVFSIGIHVVLLLLFAFFGLSYTTPPPEEEGISINLGFVDAGSMTENPNTSAVAEEQVEEIVPETAQPVESSEEVLTQDSEEAPAIPEKKEEKVVEKKEEKKEEPKPDKNLNKALEKWKNKKDQGEAGGDGNTDQQGDQGAANGDPNSNSYVGGGSGNGTSFNLSGRNLLSSPRIQDNSQEEGKVVVDIIVDRSGKVLRATAGARGSNTTSALLYKKAKDAAMRTKFNANPNAAEEQKGQMTFIFILN